MEANFYIIHQRGTSDWPFAFLLLFTGIEAAGLFFFFEKFMGTGSLSAALNGPDCCAPQTVFVEIFFSKLAPIIRFFFAPGTRRMAVSIPS